LFGLGGLQKAVEAFKDAAGVLALESTRYPVPMIHPGVNDLDQRG